MSVKAYNEKKEGLEAEVEEFDFLIITINDLIVVVVIMFIKFFQGSKYCSTWTIVSLIFIGIVLSIHSFFNYLSSYSKYNKLFIDKSTLLFSKSSMLNNYVQYIDTACELAR